MQENNHLTRREFLVESALTAAITLTERKASKADTVPKVLGRERVSLNGVWNFAPAVTGENSLPRHGFGRIKVPGSWANLGETRDSPDLVVRGTGAEWNGFNGESVSRAWYVRQTTIPTEWSGRSISLCFDRICTDAVVFANGVECGRAPWPWGSVDITKAVTPGRMADIQVLVAAIPNSELAGSFWQNAFMAVTYSKSQLATRGLTGNVYLESRASEAYITDVFIRTSTRKKEIRIDIELANIKQPGDIRIEAEMLNEKGAIEKRFSSVASVISKPSQTVTVFRNWNNPRIWDVGRPNLYTLQLTVTGAGVYDRVQERFGFREFWTEGRNFYLNGSIIRLRQPCFLNGPVGSIGDIFSEFGTWTPDTRGDTSDASHDLDYCDQIGYLAAVYALDANRYMRDSNGNLIWDQSRTRALERADVWMRHYRNHPSVVMWVAGANFFNNAVDQDPRHIGRHGWVGKDSDWRPLMDDAADMFRRLKQLDPTRVYYSHEGADTGDVHSMNCYLDLTPLQEREDWLSVWAESGEMPISMTEFGTPTECSFRRGHDGFGSNVLSEPLLTEYAAIYLGSDAYEFEGLEYRKWLHDQFVGGMEYKSSQDRLEQFPVMHPIQALFRKRTWRSWRTAGLSGGLKSWSWLQDELKEVNYPTLAWIAGPPEAYTAKDHHFIADGKFRKQIILINDTRRRQNFKAQWIATIGDRTVGRGDLRGSLAVSEIRKLPIELATPHVRSERSIEGQIKLNATIGDETHQDTFTFRVFGKRRSVSGAVATVDSLGPTGKMMESLGLKCRVWNGEGAKLVVAGRNALRDNPAVLSRLEHYVKDGGRVLILGHDPKWITEALGWRVCPKVSRYVFPIPNTTFASGVDSDDLRDWTGESALIQAYPTYVGDYLRGNEGAQPYAGWHWGNRGGVCSAAIEKPHRSGWTPLLECEFDLAYTPLMELNYGKGRLIVCTLDLEDHMELDPAARWLAAKVMDYSLQHPLEPRLSNVVYLGGSAGADWLNSIGVSYERSEIIDPKAGLMLVGADARPGLTELNAYLENGGKAFFLPQAQSNGLFGVELKQAVNDFAGSLKAPGWREARGLSASDLRWRTHMDVPAWLVSGGAEIGADGLLGRKTVGKGVAIYCQVDPNRFNADRYTYFRYTRWRSTRAVAQVIANLGASFSMDSQIFHPREPVTNPDAKWLGPNGDRAGHDCHPPIPSRLLDMPPNWIPNWMRSGYYHPDYLTDFPMGDNPYRYYRW